MNLLFRNLLEVTLNNRVSSVHGDYYKSYVHNLSIAGSYGCLEGQLERELETSLLDREGFERFLRLVKVRCGIREVVVHRDALSFLIEDIGDTSRKETKGAVHRKWLSIQQRGEQIGKESITHALGTPKAVLTSSPSSARMEKLNPSSSANFCLLSTSWPEMPTTSALNSFRMF